MLVTGKSALDIVVVVRGQVARLRTRGSVYNEKIGFIVETQRLCVLITSERDAFAIGRRSNRADGSVDARDFDHCAATRRNGVDLCALLVVIGLEPLIRCEVE